MLSSNVHTDIYACFAFDQFLKMYVEEAAIGHIAINDNVQMKLTDIFTGHLSHLH